MHMQLSIPGQRIVLLRDENTQSSRNLFHKHGRRSESFFVAFTYERVLTLK